MSAAESPSLRHLVRSFRELDADLISKVWPEDEDSVHSEPIILGIENKAWTTLLSNSEIPRLKPGAANKRARPEPFKSTGSRKKSCTGPSSIQDTETLDLIRTNFLPIGISSDDKKAAPPILELFMDHPQPAGNPTSARSSVEPTLTWSEGAYSRQPSDRYSELDLLPICTWNQRGEQQSGLRGEATMNARYQAPNEDKSVLKEEDERGIMWNDSWDIPEEKTLIWGDELI